MEMAQRIACSGRSNVARKPSPTDLTGVFLAQYVECVEAELVDDGLEVELEGVDREVADVCLRETRVARVELYDHPMTGEPLVPGPWAGMLEVRVEADDNRLPTGRLTVQPGPPW
jgi:hypothetical protein